MAKGTMHIADIGDLHINPFVHNTPLYITAAGSLRFLPLFLTD
jgi:hypothetical protein